MDNPIRYGFRAVGTRDGSGMPAPHRGFVATAYSSSQAATTVDINIGDPVRRLATGYFAHAGAGEDIYGVCVGVVQYFDGSKIVFGKKLPAGTAYTLQDRASEILVLPATGIVFEVDCDENSTAATYAAYLALIGENCDHIFVPSGTTGYPRLDISTHATATSGWRIRDISPSVDNQDFTGNYVKVHVVVNETQEAPFVVVGV